MIIRVTQEHIDAGTPRDDCLCPIARAVCAVVPMARVSVARIAVHLSYRVYPMPRRARDFVRDFDEGIRVDPFEFELDIPDIPGSFT